MNQALTKTKRDVLKGGFSVHTSPRESIRIWREKSGSKLKSWNDVAAIRKWRDHR